MEPGNIELVVDPVDELIEELAALTAAWQKNRDRKRPSPILRRSILTACCEVWETSVILEDNKKCTNADA